MSKADCVKTNGIIVEAFPNAMFKVDIGNGHTVLGHISGKMRINYIKLVPGDNVEVELSPYDLTKCRIVTRMNKDDKKYTSKQTCDESLENKKPRADNLYVARDVQNNKQNKQDVSLGTFDSKRGNRS